MGGAVMNPPRKSSKAIVRRPATSAQIAATEKIVFDLENPVATARDLAMGIAMLADTLAVDEGSVIGRLALLIVDTCCGIEQARDALHQSLRGSTMKGGCSVAGGRSPSTAA
jgi:hypothetical protein